MRTQPGRFHAPQFGLPRRDLKVQRVDPTPRKFSQQNLEELTKLVDECNRRDLTGVIRR